MVFLKAQNHPEFSVSIYDMEEEELMLDLRENRIDIALLYLPNNKITILANIQGTEV